MEKTNFGVFVQALNRKMNNIQSISKKSPVNPDKWVDRYGDYLYRKGQWKIKPVKWNADPQKLIEQQEFMKVLHDCLSQLSQRHANAFILREITGEKVKEICKILDITPTNCWVILYRARMYLRRCLEISWFIDETHEEFS